MYGVDADFQAWAGNGGAGVSFGDDSSSQGGKGSMPGIGGMGWRRHRRHRHDGSSDDSSSPDGPSPSSDGASESSSHGSADQSGGESPSDATGSDSSSDGASAGGDASSGDGSADTTGSDASSGDGSADASGSDASSGDGSSDASGSDVSSSDSASGGGDTSSPASGDTQGTGTGRPVVTMTRIAHATITVAPGQDAPKSSEQPAISPSSGSFSSGGSSSSGASSDPSSQPSKIQSSSSPAETSSQPAQAETSSTPSSSGMSADDTQALALQNAARKAVGVPPLSWSPMLVSVAKSWAEKLKSESCAFKHSGGKYGENLGMGTSNIAGAINMFLSEKSSYNNQPISGSMTGSDGQSYGHYTQVIWKSTTTVGCYYEPTCKLTVCNYDPAGNMIGSTPTEG